MPIAVFRQLLASCLELQHCRSGLPQVFEKVGWQAGVQESGPERDELRWRLPVPSGRNDKHDEPVLEQFHLPVTSVSDSGSNATQRARRHWLTGLNWATLLT